MCTFSKLSKSNTVYKVVRFAIKMLIVHKMSEFQNKSFVHLWRMQQSKELCSRPVPVVGSSLTHSLKRAQWNIHQVMLMQLLIRCSALLEVTHQPSHHTRILRLLFSGLHAAALGVGPASFPADAAVFTWWWWCPFFIIFLSWQVNSQRCNLKESRTRRSPCKWNGKRTVWVVCPLSEQDGRFLWLFLSCSSSTAMRQRLLDRRRSYARRSYVK